MERKKYPLFSPIICFNLNVEEYVDTLTFSLKLLCFYLKRLGNQIISRNVVCGLSSWSISSLYISIICLTVLSCCLFLSCLWWFHHQAEWVHHQSRLAQRVSTQQELHLAAGGAHAVPHHAALRRLRDGGERCEHYVFASAWGGFVWFISARSVWITTGL